MSVIQKFYRCTTHMDDAAGDLTVQAIALKIGVRWMRSALLNAIDEAIFDAPKARNFKITVRDGKLRCRTQSSRECAAPTISDSWMSV